MTPLLLLFDLDGTLVDSREDLATAINLMRADFSMQPLPLETVSGFIGDGVHRLVARALDGRPADIERAVAIMQAHYEKHLYDKTRLYPGVQQGLDELRSAGHSLALVSNKIVSASEAILKHFGVFHLFQVVIGGDSLPHLKPHPAPLLEAMRLAGFDPANTWMIGDHVTDMAAAQAAGVSSVFVNYGIGHAGDYTPHQRFDTFDELVAFFNQAAPGRP